MPMQLASPTMRTWSVYLKERRRTTIILLSTQSKKLIDLQYLDAPIHNVLDISGLPQSIIIPPTQDLNTQYELEAMNSHADAMSTHDALTE